MERYRIVSAFIESLRERHGFRPSRATAIVGASSPGRGKGMCASACRSRRRAGDHGRIQPLARTPPGRFVKPGALRADGHRDVSTAEGQRHCCMLSPPIFFINNNAGRGAHFRALTGKACSTGSNLTCEAIDFHSKVIDSMSTRGFAGRQLSPFSRALKCP